VNFNSGYLECVELSSDRRVCAIASQPLLRPQFRDAPRVHHCARRTVAEWIPGTGAPAGSRRLRGAMAPGRLNDRSSGSSGLVAVDSLVTGVTLSLVVIDPLRAESIRTPRCSQRWVCWAWIRDQNPPICSIRLNVGIFVSSHWPWRTPCAVRNACQMTAALSQRPRDFPNREQLCTTVNEHSSSLPLLSSRLQRLTLRAINIASRLNNFRHTTAYVGP